MHTFRRTMFGVKNRIRKQINLFRRNVRKRLRQFERFSHDVQEITRYPFSRAIEFLNWRIVRSIAELQILTRASYITLILVPLLAGLWPTVRLVFNQHNKAAIAATSALDDSSNKFSKALSHTVSTIELPSRPADSQNIEAIGSLLAETKRKIAAFNSEFGDQALSSIHVPRALAAAFLAALAIALAQTIYQIFAPETVRRMTLEEFVASQKDDYGKHPTPSAVHDARDTLRRLRGGASLRLKYFKQRRRKNLNRREIEMQLYGKYGDDLDKFIRKLPPIDLFEMRERYNIYPNRFPAGGSKIEDIYLEVSREINPDLRKTLEDQVKMSIVSQAARQTYLEFSSKNRIATAITAAIYVVAIYMIFSIMVNQTMMVLDSSNIHSTGEAFEWWQPSRVQK